MLLQIKHFITDFLLLEIGTRLVDNGMHTYIHGYIVYTYTNIFYG